MIINKKNTPHYTWGNNCGAWVLLQSEYAIIKEEIMPPSAEESLHYHTKMEQLFYILEGQANFFIDKEVHIVNQQEAIKAAPNQHHKICNHSNEPIRFLVISFPGKLDDRIEVNDK